MVYRRIICDDDHGTSAIKDADIINQNRRYSLVGTVRQEVGSNVLLSLDVKYSDDSQNEAIGAHSVSKATIDNGNPYFVAPPGTAATSETILYNTGLLGLQTDPFTDKSAMVDVGASIDLGHSWVLNSDVDFGWSRSTAIDEGYSSVLLGAALASTDSATALDPFGSLTNPEVAASILNYPTNWLATQKLYQVNATATGSLFTLPGGNVKVAVGGDWRTETYAALNSTGVPTEAGYSVATVREGLVVVGRAPRETPSLADDPHEFTVLRNELWGRDGRGGAVGRGHVYGDLSLDAALAASHVAPDVSSPNRTMGKDVLFVHRRLSDGDLYFVDHRSGHAGPVTLSFRVSGKEPEVWRAATGTRDPVSYRVENGRTVVTLRLAGEDSFFILFRKPTTATSRTVITRHKVLTHIDGPWLVRFQPGRGAPAQPVELETGSWTRSAQPGIRYFSGTATYSRDLVIPAAWVETGHRLELSLGDVREIADVSVNGRPIGVRWTEPYRFDITDAVHAGTNHLSIKVTNLWVNRMIGDRQPGARSIAKAVGIRSSNSWYHYEWYRADAPLRPSGIIGPVTLEQRR